MKRNLSSMLIIGLIFATIFSGVAMAGTNSIVRNNKTSTEFSHEDYQNLKAAGAIGEDVSYEDLLQLNQKAKTKEIELNNNAQLFVLPRGVVMKPGDIIISNSTSSAGLTGHAGIAITGSTILHIGGFGESVSRDSVTTFKNRYNAGWIRVYRLNNATMATKAANWANNAYRGTNAIYKLTTNLATTHETYCSKMVWQAYYYGVGKNVVEPLMQNITTGYRLPYDLPDILSGGDYTVSLVGDL